MTRDPSIPSPQANVGLTEPTRISNAELKDAEPEELANLQVEVQKEADRLQQGTWRGDGRESVRTMASSTGTVMDVVDCCIAHDALVAGGSSGGPLLDARYQVLGLNTLLSKKTRGQGQRDGSGHHDPDGFHPGHSAIRASQGRSGGMTLLLL